MNTLIVHVVAARGLHIKAAKPVDVYCSLATSGKGPWKSKVSTNTMRIDPQRHEQSAELRWDEHCEFQLNNTDTKMVVHINHKTVFGTTETLGELVLQISQMARFQPPVWFQLTKAGSADQQHGLTPTQNNRERGQILLGFQFSNVLSTKGAASISNTSLDRTGKEKKINRIKRKMQQFGRKTIGGAGEDGTGNDDAKSLTSISIAAGQFSFSRRSSISSTNSGVLAFTPSPNPTPIPDEQEIRTKTQTTAVNLTAINSSTAPDQLSMHSITSGGASDFFTHYQQQQHCRQITPSNVSSNQQHLLQPNIQQNSMSARSSLSACSGKLGQHNETPISSEKIRVTMRQKAEQLLHLRALTGGVGNSATKKQQRQRQIDFNNQQLHDLEHQAQNSRRDSVASSSGFVSFGSGQLSTLNEDTSPEHLLNVIKHLRNELLKKEQRIRDLEQYTDKLVNKVMMSNPELLQSSPKLGASNNKTTHRKC